MHNTTYGITIFYKNFQNRNTRESGPNFLYHKIYHQLLNQEHGRPDRRSGLVRFGAWSGIWIKYYKKSSMEIDELLGIQPSNKRVKRDCENRASSYLPD